MIFTAIRIIAMLAALSVLQGCAVSTQPSLASAVPNTTVPTQHAPELDSLADGDSVVFYTGVLSSLGQVTIGREYTAASGRVCKKILSASGDQLVSVACRAKMEHWYVRTLPIVGDGNGFTSIDTLSRSDDGSLLLQQR